MWQSKKRRNPAFTVCGSRGHCCANRANNRLLQSCCGAEKVKKAYDFYVYITITRIYNDIKYFSFQLWHCFPAVFWLQLAAVSEQWTGMKQIISLGNVCRWYCMNHAWIKNMAWMKFKLPKQPWYCAPHLYYVPGCLGDRNKPKNLKNHLHISIQSCFWSTHVQLVAVNHVYITGNRLKQNYPLLWYGLACPSP